MSSTEAAVGILCCVILAGGERVSRDVEKLILRQSVSNPYLENLSSDEFLEIIEEHVADIHDKGLFEWAKSCARNLPRSMIATVACLANELARVDDSLAQSRTRIVQLLKDEWGVSENEFTEMLDGSHPDIARH